MQRTGACIGIPLGLLIGVIELLARIYLNHNMPHWEAAMNQANIYQITRIRDGKSGLNHSQFATRFVAQQFCIADEKLSLAIQNVDDGLPATAAEHVGRAIRELAKLQAHLLQESALKRLPNSKGDRRQWDVKTKKLSGDCQESTCIYRTTMAGSIGLHKRLYQFGCMFWQVDNTKVLLHLLTGCSTLYSRSKGDREMTYKVQVEGEYMALCQTGEKETSDIESARNMQAKYRLNICTERADVIIHAFDRFGNYSHTID
jgi:hypothetical protein